MNSEGNNLNADLKNDKIAKDIINASKSRNNKNPSFSSQTDQQFHFKKTGATSDLKNHKMHGIITNVSII